MAQAELLPAALLDLDLDMYGATTSLTPKFRYYVLFCLLLTSCSNLRVAPSQLISKSSQTKSLKVHFISQKNESQCGMAAVQMIEHYYSRDMNSQQVKQLEDLANSNHGLSGQQLKQAFIENHFEVVIFSGDLSHQVRGIFRYLDQEHPLIAMIKLKNDFHYILITGYDKPNNRILAIDPAIGEISLTQDVFNILWNSAGNFILLALPEDIVAEGFTKESK